MTPFFLSARRRGPNFARAVTAVLTAVVLSGCAADFPAATTAFAPPEPPPAVVSREPALISIASRIRAAYARKEASYVADGRMRLEFAPADAPYTNQQLLENFLVVALYAEQQTGRTGVLAAGGRRSLRRWESSIRYRFVGGGVRLSDRREVDRLTRLFSGASGLSIDEASSSKDVNFLIEILNAEERLARLFVLEEMGDPERLAFEMAWLREPQWPCIGEFSLDESGAIRVARILIKDEVSERLRPACLAEEFAQSLGLPNDSFYARPSIFNDNQEFAALTEHDLNLIRILYDTRLFIGDEPRDAAPIAANIIAELRPQGGPMSAQTAVIRAQQTTQPPPPSGQVLAQNGRGQGE